MIHRDWKVGLRASREPSVLRKYRWELMPRGVPQLQSTESSRRYVAIQGYMHCTFRAWVSVTGSSSHYWK